MSWESIIKKFMEQAEKNALLEEKLAKIKNEQYELKKCFEEEKNKNPDMSAFIIDLYKTICEKIEKFHIKDGQLFLGENLLGDVCGKDGKDGLNGKDGKDGKDGKNGKNGLDGKNGEKPKITADEKNIYVDGKVLIPLEKLKGKDGGRSLRTLFDLMSDYGFSSDEDKLTDIVKKLEKTDFDDKPTKNSENIIKSGDFYDLFTYKLLKEKIITQEEVDAAGDEGVTYISVGDGKEYFLKGYSDIMMRIVIPIDSEKKNTEDGTLRIGMSQDFLSQTLVWGGNYEFLRSQSQIHLPINKDYSNIFVVKTTLNPSGSVFSTQVVQQRLGNPTYPNTVYGTNSSSFTNVFNTRYISVNNGIYQKEYKFPAGTTLQVYGRKLMPFE